MPELVYASGGGLRYHDNPGCHALTGGQNLNDWDCECWGRCPHSSPRAVVPLEPADAAAQGKSPCLSCFPAGAMRYLPQPTAGDDFGHEPMDVIWNGKLRAVECYRCRRIPWPCTTAIILGLEPRTTA
ncbi:MULTISPECIES: hypothetical protein [unclassified Streptomyces]|uniref:hypothetical protein n=1 Tax=unclassified Streptomyces TaxID=2593676 RepID=UPI00331EC1BB